MISLEALSKFVDGRIKRVDNNILLAKRHKMETFLHEDEKSHLIDLKKVIELLCNEKALQFAECEVCGGLYINKRKKQAVCSGKCRTKLHRMKKQEVNHE